MAKTKRECRTAKLLFPLVELEETRQGMQRFLADWESRTRALTELRADVIEVRRLLRTVTPVTVPEAKLEAPPAG
jgi:hypothetical protein